MASKEFLAKRFKLTLFEVAKLLKSYSRLENRDEERIEKELTDLQQTFEIDDQKAVKVAKNYPQILDYSSETINSQAKMLQTCLDISFKNAKNLIVKHPRLISCSEKKANQAIDGIAKNLKITKKQASEILQNNPILITSFSESIEDKIKLYIECGYKNAFVEYPKILSAPANQIKIRCIMKNVFKIDDKRMIMAMTQSNQRTYALGQFAINAERSSSIITTGDLTNLNIDIESLCVRYKFNEKSIKNLIKEHNSNLKFTPINLTQKEIDLILAESFKNQQKGGMRDE